MKSGGEYRKSNLSGEFTLAHVRPLQSLFYMSSNFSKTAHCTMELTYDIKQISLKLRMVHMSGHTGHPRLPSCANVKHGEIIKSH
jgi:hypothetical protein